MSDVYWSEVKHLELSWGLGIRLWVWEKAQVPEVLAAEAEQIGKWVHYLYTVNIFMIPYWETYAI